MLGSPQNQKERISDVVPQKEDSFPPSDQVVGKEDGEACKRRGDHDRKVEGEHRRVELDAVGQLAAIWESSLNV